LSSSSLLLLSQGDFVGGVAAMTFCDMTAEGSKLACLGIDARLVIYNWRLGTKLTESKTEVEPSRSLLSLCSDGRHQFVTSGIDHIKFW
jgi:hypothetical protein